MHPLLIKRLVAVLQNPLQIDAGRLARCIRTLTRDGIIGSNYIAYAECQPAGGQLADWLVLPVPTAAITLLTAKPKCPGP